MCSNFNLKVFIGSVVLLITFYGCAITTTIPIAEAQGNQDDPGTQAGVLNSTVGDKRPVTGVSKPTVGDKRPIGDTFPPSPFREPRYKVEALSFRCIHETGSNWPGSDEITVYIDTPEHSLVIGVFEDVDAGETRSFRLNKRCILPVNEVGRDTSKTLWSEQDVWTCSNKGVPGPFTLRVTMYEMDQNALPACFAPKGYPCGNDDLIDSQILTFTAEELAAAMPNVGDTFDETIRLSPCTKNVCGGFGSGPYDAEYRFTYRLTRLPDRIVGRLPTRL